MKAPIFYNETALNGRYQVKTAIQLTGEEIRQVGTNDILTHKNEIFKGLKNYWVSLSALNEIKANNLTERACF